MSEKQSLGMIRKFGFFLVSVLLFACQTRTDIILSATDELHYIHLYEEGKEFELLYNGLNTAIGVYSLHGDTIHLHYEPDQFEEFDPNEVLCRLILIDSAKKKVNAIDERMHFCANVILDNRKN